MEKAILAHSLAHPTRGSLRVAQQLCLQGIQVSLGGVRGVWSCHDQLSRHSRLLLLERSVHEQSLELNDDQVRALERFSPKFRVWHIETRHTDDLVAVDTFFGGTLKGLGRVFLQSVLACHSRYAWGRLTHPSCRSRLSMPPMKMSCRSLSSMGRRWPRPCRTTTGSFAAIRTATP